MVDKIVFISGPYSGKDLAQKLANVALAIGKAEELRQYGYTPFIPHLLHFWDALYEHDWEYWMEICLTVLKRCDALYRLPGESKGADLEVASAKELGLGVYYSVEELVTHE